MRSRSQLGFRSGGGSQPAGSSRKKANVAGWRMTLLIPIGEMLSFTTGRFHERNRRSSNGIVTDPSDHTSAGREIDAGVAGRCGNEGDHRVRVRDIHHGDVRLVCSRCDSELGGSRSQELITKLHHHRRAVSRCRSPAYDQKYEHKDDENSRCQKDLEHRLGRLTDQGSAPRPAAR